MRARARRYSGITEDLLKQATLTLPEARARVAHLVAGKVLVGHSLECDLAVLGLAVPLAPGAPAATQTPDAR